MKRDRRVFYSKQLSTEELEIGGQKNIINEVKAESLKDLGKVMGVAFENFFGKI